MKAARAGFVVFRSTQNRDSRSIVQLACFALWAMDISTTGRKVMLLVLCALCGSLAAAVVTFAFNALIPLNGLHQVLLASGIGLIVGNEASGHPTLRRCAGRWRRSWRRMAASAGWRQRRHDVPTASPVAARVGWMWVSYAVLVLWTAVETVTGSAGSSAAFVSPGPDFLASAAPTPATLPLGSVMAQAARVAGESMLLSAPPGASDSAPYVAVETSRGASRDGPAAATYYVLREALLDRLAQNGESPSF